MIKLFRKQSQKNLPVDIHSHLLPGIDDGVNTVDEALDILDSFVKLGYKKVITTPHINPEFFPNTEEIIIEKYYEVKRSVEKAGIEIKFEASAEYFLCEDLMQKLEQKKKLLTFSDGYLLFECSFLNEPFFLKDFIFHAISQGYKPVLAHPERYAFVHQNFQILEDLKQRDVRLQININSLSGAYQKAARKTAEKMIKKGMVDLLGSDCHNKRHAELLKETKSSKYFQKALDLPLLNYQL